MPYVEVIWDLDDDPDGNVVHLADHGVTKDEAAEVLAEPLATETSRSSGRPIAIGVTSTGRRIAVVYEQIDEISVKPVTAYDLD